MTPSELQDLLAQNANFALIDVRTPEETHIPGTLDTIDYLLIHLQTERLPKDTNALIILYCRSGQRSGIAAENLRALGFTNIHNLEGGIIGWNAFITA